MGSGYIYVFSNSFEFMQVIIFLKLYTFFSTPGLNDNGSGVTVMLEIASTLMNSKCFVNDHTVIFVAIDAEETGCLGSFEFIRSFLIPDVISDKGIQIGGVIILDSIFNWDDRPGSQDVPDQWSNVVPKKVIKSIKENGNKGDFIGDMSLYEKRCVKLILIFCCRCYKSDKQ